MEDELIDSELKLKCHPILKIIEDAKQKALKEYVNPRILLMSPNAFYTLKFAVFGEFKDFIKSPDDDGIFYENMEVWVDHSMKDYSIKIFGTILDELNHSDNFNKLSVSASSASSYILNFQGLNTNGSQINSRDFLSIFSRCSRLFSSR